MNQFEARYEADTLSASQQALRVLKPTVLAVAMGCVGSAWAVDGGVVVNGTGKIATAGTSTTVTQLTDKMVVNWKNFDIAQGQTVTFAQPTKSAAVLNRIDGPIKATDIQGTLNANGRVYVVNPAGVMFGQNAVVNADSLVASTLDIGAQQFMAGGRVSGTQKVLDLTSGTRSASVVNQGKINARQVALLGGQVLNKGQINATGDVTLGAADAATLTLTSSGFSVGLGAPELNAMVENGGMIVSKGGDVRLTAAATGDALRNAVRNTGTVEARTVNTMGGSIELRSDADGQIAIGGKLTGDNRVSVQTTSRAAKGRTVVIEPLAQLSGTQVEVNALGSTLTSNGVYTAKQVTLGGDKVLVNAPITADQIQINGDTSVAQKANLTGTGMVRINGKAIDQSAGVTTTGATIEMYAGDGTINASTLKADQVRLNGKTIALNGDVSGKWGVDAVSDRSGSITALKQVSSELGGVNLSAVNGKVVTRGAINANSDYRGGVTLSGNAVEVYAPITAKGDINLLGQVTGVRQEANVTSTEGGVVEQGGALYHAAGVTTSAAHNAQFLSYDRTLPVAFNLGDIKATGVIVDNANGAVNLNGTVNADGAVHVTLGNGSLVTKKAVKSQQSDVNLTANNITTNDAIEAGGNANFNVNSTGKIELAGPVTAGSSINVGAPKGTYVQKGALNSQGDINISANTLTQASTSTTTAAHNVYLSGTTVNSGTVTAGDQIMINAQDTTLGGKLTARFVNVPANAKNTAGNIVVTQPQPQPNPYDQTVPNPDPYQPQPQPQPTGPYLTVDQLKEGVLYQRVYVNGDWFFVAML